MKKTIAIMLVAAAIGTAAFAQGKSLSAGVYVSPIFGGTIEKDLKTTYSGAGFGAYFDAKYVAVNLGLNIMTPAYDGTKADDPQNYFAFGILGKYPIAIGTKFSIAPAVGIEYLMFTSYGDIKRADVDDVAKDIDLFLIKFGALADFTITGGLYARAGVLAILSLAHKDSDPKDSAFGVEIPIGIGLRF